MIRPTGFCTFVATLALTSAMALATPTETILRNFHGASDGAVPQGDLIAGPDGSLYGVTYRGGPTDHGTVFRLSPPAAGKTSWTLKVLRAFTGTDGASPLAGVIRNSAGELFGTTNAGATADHGMVYRLTPPAPGGTAWTMTILHRFGNSNYGVAPASALVTDGNGVLYGTTSYGGLRGSGVVFSLTPPAPGNTAWTYRVLLHLTSTKEGYGPGTLVRGSDGRLYGATAMAAAGGHGAVFVLTPPAPGKTNWTSSVAHAFTGAPDGATAAGAPRLKSTGELFGTTEYGGTADHGIVYRLTPPAPGKTAWTETILHRFTGGAGGANPYGSVRITGTGALVGVTDGLDGAPGTLFRLDPPAAGQTVWTRTILHRFTGLPDGSDPYGTPLIRGGVYYGTTGYGGSTGNGTIWRVVP